MVGCTWQIGITMLAIKGFYGILTDNLKDKESLGGEKT